MIAVPAVDLSGGRCVQWVGGLPETERVSLPDPAAVAARWWRKGFRTVHVVDLDAALARGDNHAVARELISRTGARVQFGGGVRDRAGIERALAAGADRVIVGTRAVEDPGWLARAAAAFPHRVMVAADMRGGRVLLRGWTRASETTVGDFLAALDDLPLAGVLCTDVAREGRVQGGDAKRAGAVIRASPHPVWISGGICSLGELRSLGSAGAAGAVLGMALYDGTLSVEAVAREFGGRDNRKAKER